MKAWFDEEAAGNGVVLLHILGENGVEGLALRRWYEEMDIGDDQCHHLIVQFVPEPSPPGIEQ